MGNFTEVLSSSSVGTYVSSTGIAGTMQIILIIGIPFLLGIIGVKRSSITGYIAGVVGLSLALSMVWDSIGASLGIPLVLVILGFMLSAMRNAWGEGLRIF